MSELIKKIKTKEELCTTTEGDQFECISIENLKKVLGKDFSKIEEEVEFNTEYLDNEKDEEIECISIENVEGALKRAGLV